MLFLFWATAVVWSALFIWIYTAIYRQQLKLEQQIKQLRDELERMG
ncbi:hypothetical protein CathTA2_0310 [Caldalkalibacillus thermarum TA2.A1]|uniref:CcmD family protein n=1 Tax=Caldalkalibacillus thermarum (strain TA2.A1) TaxID=986075 RepID=F5L3E9_CALTT|nr:hypothetical protein [Caldalkalibacillus thermarum]EGL84128.1 hypothetical protein CathTA2_0310 [Caldalkalibacillus thermarum TA2.A1]QZT35039.1 hypothetical protein HUR95_07360 [Caldalkalibacillus thermarum TA2.A1]